MLKKYASIVLKLCSLGLVVAAGSCWAGAGVNSRPKYKDEQTLVGGTIWSQIVIPVGVIVSKIVGEHLDAFVHGFFLVSGFLLLLCNGIFLLTRECLVMTRHRRRVMESRSVQSINDSHLKFDTVYGSIGVLTLLAGVLTAFDFLLLLI